MSFHDRVGALAVLTTFSRLPFSIWGEFVDLLAGLVVKRGRLEHIVQFVDQFSRQRREINDEIERVLDLMRDPRGELASEASFSVCTRDPVRYVNRRAKADSSLVRS